MFRKFVTLPNFKTYDIDRNNVRVRLNENIVGNVVFFEELVTPVINKSVIVNTLITANYPSDKMDAIRNNYDLVRDGVAGEKTEEYTKEYLEMQTWRKEAKKLADEIINEYNKEK